MNINWKIRLKNPSFWVSIIIAIFTPILAYMGLTAENLSSWVALGDVLVKAISNPYILVLVITSVYNAVIDPTTKGISDSVRAQNYNEPAK